jgi:predicted HicB family RNase H-like nuclease
MAPSGKFVVRLPAELHAHLIEKAKAEGVSLNALVLSYLAGASGFKRERPKRKP